MIPLNAHNTVVTVPPALYSYLYRKHVHLVCANRQRVYATSTFPLISSTEITLFCDERIDSTADSKDRFYL